MRIKLLSAVALTALVGMAAPEAATDAVTDAPRYENRWIFAIQFMDDDVALRQTKALVRRAKAAGYNGIAFISGSSDTAATERKGITVCSGLDDWEHMTDDRRARFRELRRFCDAERFDFVPLVWSTGHCSMMHVDPNFVACWPVRDVPYRVSGGRARFAPEPLAVDLSRFNRTYDCTGKDDIGLSVTLPVKPCRRYRLTTQVKVEGVLYNSVYSKVGPQYAVASKASGDYSVAHSDRFESVQDWTDSGFTFVTGEEDAEVTLSCRVKAYGTGKIVIRNAKIEEIGVECPVRRAGTHFEVKDAKTGRVYREGIDYASVPSLKVAREDLNAKPIELVALPGGTMAEGADVLVTAWEPQRVYGNQHTACFTNPALKDYYKRSAQTLADALGLTKWFVSADEIRVGCRCENCRKDPDVAGVRIGKDYRAQYEAIKAACPDADIYMWADMANINHNAMASYYLMGDTRGALDYISKDVTLVSWWCQKAAINLPYYTARGYRTLCAGYYDRRDAAGTRKQAEAWRRCLDETPNARGFMYTTWLPGIGLNFAFLEDFIDAFDSAVPYAPTRPGALPKKLMSFNVHAGRGGRESGEVKVKGEGEVEGNVLANLEACAAVIRREKPDWCSIQEVDILAARSAKVDQVHELAQRTGMFPVFGQTLKHKGGQATGAYGVMALSREKPLRYSIVPLEDKTEPRALLVTEYDKFIAVATHFSLQADDALTAAAKANELFAASAKPVFLAGDLNSTADSAAIAELKKNFVALTDGTTPTLPTDAPTGPDARAIDWIFVDHAHAAAFAGSRASVLPDAKSSDHFPVVVEL